MIKSLSGQNSNYQSLRQNQVQASRRKLSKVEEYKTNQQPVLESPTPQVQPPQSGSWLKWGVTTIGGAAIVAIGFGVLLSTIIPAIIIGVSIIAASFFIKIFVSDLKERAKIQQEISQIPKDFYKKSVAANPA